MSLFLRTFSQGLQAFMPIAVALAWCHAIGARRWSAAIGRGLVMSIPASVAGAWLFRFSSNQRLNEALLAVSAVVIALRFSRLLQGSDAPGHGTQVREPGKRALWAATAASCVIVARQTAEVLSLLQTATMELRSLEATYSLVAGVVTAGVVARLCVTASRRLPTPLVRGATWTFLTLFVVQAVIYASHEFSEARLLPWSQVLHTATEPYGPDGVYGMHFSDLLVVVPLAAVAWLWARARVRVGDANSRRLVTHRCAAAAIALSSCLLMGMQQGDARSPQAAPAARAEDIAAMAARPHVLFRDTTPGGAFGRLTMTSLSAPNGERLSTALTCQRLSFGGGRGICLQLQRGVFNTYTAVLLDRSLRPGTAIKLEGLPSRTRVSADGRVGVVTVFVVGEDYAADFSTRTTLLDLASGDEIGQLEEFSTWRDGTRFRAVDFNFWGGTFTRDGTTFYATLRTAGRIFLVRGDLALRKLTVVRENVECPSLSPDNRLLAYKKRVGPSPDSWRLHVLDLQTNVERIVGVETRFIDDQVEWLDDRHILYAVPRRTTVMSDVWMAPIEGGEPARIFLSQAESPTVVRSINP